MKTYWCHVRKELLLIVCVDFDELFPKVKHSNFKTPIIILTTRMGFGHHRLAYSTASWAIHSGHPTIFHDFMGIKSSTVCFVFI
jgi:hypothetical protein